MKMRKQASRILVVDDEPTIVFAITRYFRSRGFEVEGAADKGTALGLLDRGCPDLAIVDLRLDGHGDTQGLEVIDYARSRCPEAKTVLLTAYGSSQIEAEASRRGVDLVLRKPTPLPEIAKAVEELIALRGDPAKIQGQ
jgi:ActR/RegA family two-component response regulator